MSHVHLAKEWAALDKVMQTVHLQDGEVLFSKGDRGDALYIIESGQVRIFTFEEQGGEITINILKAGAVFGEMALVDDQPRSASAAAIGATTLRRLSREELDLTSPDLIQEIIRLLSERARNLTDYIERMGQWARLIAQGRYSRVLRMIEQGADSADGTLVAAATAMGEMVKAIREREEALRQEAIKLRIQIDESGRQERVAEIVETEYFQSLAQRAHALRGAPRP